MLYSYLDPSACVGYGVIDGLLGFVGIEARTVLVRWARNTSTAPHCKTKQNWSVRRIQLRQKMECVGKDVLPCSAVGDNVQLLMSSGPGGCSPEGLASASMGTRAVLHAPEEQLLLIWSRPTALAW